MDLGKPCIRGTARACVQASMAREELLAEKVPCLVIFPCPGMRYIIKVWIPH